MRYMMLCKFAELPPPGGPFPVPDTQLQMNFYSRMGIVMATWQFIESGLTRVYFAATKAPSESWEGLRAAFYRNSSFNTRLDMTHEIVMRSGLDQPTKIEWSAIKTLMKSCAEKRNRIAHGQVYWAPYETEVGDNEMFIGRNLDDPKHAGSTERYYFSDLEQLSTEFDQAHEKLQGLFRKLAGV